MKKVFFIFFALLIGANLAAQVTPPTYKGGNYKYYLAQLCAEAERIAIEQQVPADSLSKKIAVGLRIDTLGKVVEWRYLDNTLTGQDSVDLAPVSAETRRVIDQAYRNLGDFTPAARDGQKIFYRVRLSAYLPIEQIAKALDPEPLRFLGEDPDKKFWDWMYVRVRFDDRFKNVGGVVHVRFFVEPNGEITIDEVLKSPDEKLSKEVIRVIRNSRGKWTPRRVNGVPQRAAYLYRCNFINETH